MEARLEHRGIAKPADEHILQRRQPIHQVELLENHTYTPAQLHPVSFCEAANILAQNVHLSVGGGNQPVDASQKCALACA
jgi:hypothetical protein